MGKKKNLTILQVNDMHGYLEDHWEHFWDGGFGKHIRVGGLARMKTYIEKVRKEKMDMFYFWMEETLFMAPTL